MNGIAVTVAVMALGGDGSFPDSKLLAIPDLEVYYSDPQVCGVVSLYYAMKLVGQTVRLGDILEEIPLDEKGCSMASLCRFLELYGVDYRTLQTTRVDEVIAATHYRARVAICHVDDGRHFVCVAQDAEGNLLVFDGTTVIRLNADRNLAKRFANAALIVGSDVDWAVRRSFGYRRAVPSVVAAIVGLGVGAIVAA